MTVPRQGGRAPSSRAAPSVLDRLLDAEPDRPHDAPRAAADSVADLRAVLHRDVETLLNARRPWRDLAATDPALRQSPLAYGLADFTAGAFNDAEARHALRADIELAIARFEPRLSDVHVHLLEDFLPLGATLRLRIDAQMPVHPQPEPISFDTAIDATTADVRLRPLADF